MKSKTYEEFVDKFKPKLTTDDCYTPPVVFEAVKAWACNEYGIDPGSVVRPFWPGGDYEHFDYPDGCTVIDNPPFSILSKICHFYAEHGIKFFLFAPALFITSSNYNVGVTVIACGADVEYANGAVVGTSFITNCNGDLVARTAPTLFDAVEAAVKANREKTKRKIPKYVYPDNVITTAMLNKYTKYGIDFSIRRGECVFVRQLDSQIDRNKAIYGSGLLVSDAKAAEKAAAEKAVAEKAAAEVWALSERERAIIDTLV